MTMDILQEIPNDELPDLRKLCIEEYPTGVHVHNFLTNAIEWREKYPDVLKVYAPNGDWKSDGTFLSTLKLPESQDLFVFTLEKSCERLYSALSESKKIIWSRRQLIGPVPMPLCPTLHKVCKEKNIKLYGDHVCAVWSIPIEKALLIDTECPDDIYIKELSPSHAKIINNLWPHKFPNSEAYIEQIIEKNRGYGVFVKANDELVSWTLMNQLGAIGFLQTADEHKRKGYAGLVTKFVAKKFAEIGVVPYSTSLLKNTSVGNMFRKIGFESNENCIFFEAYTIRT